MQHHHQDLRASTGLCDLEGAKAVARRLFDQYDKERKGEIIQVDTVPMIVEAYKSFNFQFSPSNQDINAYHKILDRNGDGRVTYDDIEQTCIRYLCPGYYQQPQPQKQEVHEHVKHHAKKPQVKYTPQVERHLDVARRLFAKFDNDGSGQLEASEVRQLLIETYRTMGMNDFQPTDDDVRAWIQMTDTDNDGQVSLPEYEAVVISSLKKAGFTIEESQGHQHIGFKQ